MTTIKTQDPTERALLHIVGTTNEPLSMAATNTLTEAARLLVKHPVLGTAFGALLTGGDVAPPVRDFPHWDESKAGLLQNTSDLFVTYEFQPNDDGSQIELQRTVWKKAYRRKDRHILWVGTVAVFRRDQIPDVMRDIAHCVTT